MYYFGDYSKVANELLIIIESIKNNKYRDFFSKDNQNSIIKNLIFKENLRRKNIILKYKYFLKINDSGTLKFIENKPENYSILEKLTGKFILFTNVENLEEIERNNTIRFDKRLTDKGKDIVKALTIKNGYKMHGFNSYVNFRKINVDQIKELKEKIKTNAENFRISENLKAKNESIELEAASTEKAQATNQIPANPPAKSSPKKAAVKTSLKIPLKAPAKALAKPAPAVKQALPLRRLSNKNKKVEEEQSFSDILKEASAAPKPKPAKQQVSKQAEEIKKRIELAKQQKLAAIVKQQKAEEAAQATQAAAAQAARATQAAAEAAQAARATQAAAQAAQAAQNKISNEAQAAQAAAQKAQNKERENIIKLKNYPYFGTIKEGKIICCNELREFRKQYKKDETYYFFKNNTPNNLTTENTVKIIGTEDNCFENDIQEVTDLDITNLQIAINAKKALAARAAHEEEKEVAAINVRPLTQTKPQYRLPTYIGYIENTVFRRIELSESSENIRRFLNRQSFIILSNSADYANLLEEGSNSLYIENVTDIFNLVNNLKQTGNNADEDIKNFVDTNFISLTKAKLDSLIKLNALLNALKTIQQFNPNPDIATIANFLNGLCTISYNDNQFWKGINFIENDINVMATQMNNFSNVNSFFKKLKFKCNNDENEKIAYLNNAYFESINYTQPKYFLIFSIDLDFNERLKRFKAFLLKSKNFAGLTPYLGDTQVPSN